MMTTQHKDMVMVHTQRTVSSNYVCADSLLTAGDVLVVHSIQFSII